MWNRRQPRQWNTWAKRANAKCRKWKPRAKNVQGTQTMSRTPSQSRRTRTNLWLRYNSLLKLRISNALISSRNEIEMPDQRKYSHWHTLTHTHPFAIETRACITVNMTSAVVETAAANIEFVHCSWPFSTCQFSCKFIVLLMGLFALCEYMVWATVRSALAHVLHAKIANGVFSDGIATWRNLR